MCYTYLVEENAMNQNEIRGNLDTGLLKIIALVCMIIDHAGVRLLGNATEWRLIGRIAFPLYLWCMVVGACYTHSPARYALRLLAVGLISQPCFMLGLNHGWNQLNVFFTLLLGYLGIWGIRENRYGSRIGHNGGFHAVQFSVCRSAVRRLQLRLVGRSCSFTDRIRCRPCSYRS